MRSTSSSAGADAKRGVGVNAQPPLPPRAIAPVQGAGKWLRDLTLRLFPRQAAQGVFQPTSLDDVVLRMGHTPRQTLHSKTKARAEEQGQAGGRKGEENTGMAEIWIILDSRKKPIVTVYRTVP